MGTFFVDQMQHNICIYIKECISQMGGGNTLATPRSNVIRMREKQREIEYKGKKAKNTRQRLKSEEHKTTAENIR